jgi:Ala-tRNA(Pro) deacylase
MINSQEIYKKVIQILDENNVEYKLFSHDPILSYDDSVRIQKTVGYVGTESKTLVMKADDSFIVYVTVQGKKVDFDLIKEKLGVKKVRLALPEELMEFFGALPGCAYPFGFDSKINIYVDPIIFDQDWLIFSPVIPIKTVQAKGLDLESLFNGLENKVELVALS